MNCICNELNDITGKTTDRCFKDFWIFEGFNDDQLEKIKGIGQKRFIKKGDPVFMEGDAGIDLFLIKTGRIKLCKINEDGSEITLDFRKAGDMLGENVFSGKSYYPLSAQAIEDTVTCGFNINNFDKLLLMHSDIGLQVIRSMSRKIFSLTDRLESMSDNSLEDRILSVLSNVAREHGHKDADGLALQIPLTHEDLGFLVGAHRVSITKALKMLTDRGKIIKNGKKITVVKC